MTLVVDYIKSSTSLSVTRVEGIKVIHTTFGFTAFETI